MSSMWLALVRKARQVWEEWRRAWQRQPVELPLPEVWPDAAVEYRPLERLVLTDDVCRTLFEEYAQHRESQRGDEETGWVLMGLREESEAIALATLPAGAEREAGIAHVRFNANAQALASRILRQEDRRLGILGVVHTHPGSLRHPSQGDYQGDRDWVALLRGQEGVFGIGTADGEDNGKSLIAHQPKEHSQCYLGLRFSWYALAEGEPAYRPLPVYLTIGPDLARPLHELWSTIEIHAEPLDRLCQRLSRVRFEVVQEDKQARLDVVIPFSAETAIRVLLREKDLEYCLVRKGEWFVSDNQEPNVERGVYLLLADLVKEKGSPS
jgi:proteasome lid subunit RPN8/RPN11